MLVGVSQKNEYGWQISVCKFKNLKTAKVWLNQEQYDFRERFIFDTEDEAFNHLKKYTSIKWAKETLENAGTLILLKDGTFDVIFSDSYVQKMMGWE